MEIDCSEARIKLSEIETAKYNTYLSFESRINQLCELLDSVLEDEERAAEVVGDDGIEVYISKSFKTRRQDPATGPWTK